MPPTNLKVGSPEWWLYRLSEQLDRRRPDMRRLTQYYEGEHDLSFATRKFEQVFGRHFQHFSNNWCGTVIQAPAERISVQGIRFDDTQEGTDQDAWDIWQANELDAWSAVHHTSTLTTGYGYVLVWSEDGEPVITIEDPEQCIVAYAPGSRRKRVAALKRWVDDLTGRENANVYTTTGVYKFESKVAEPIPGQLTTEWRPRVVVGESNPVPNPLGAVPMVEFLNDPSVAGIGRSEIQRVIPVQDGINMLSINMLVGAEFAAFRQRWATGLEIPTDPETGRPIETFEAAVNRLWATADHQTSFGEFSETNLNNYVTAIESFVQQIAAQTRTPRHYLFQSGQAPSGDAIKSAETGLVAKVRERQLHYGERWEEVIRLAFAVKDDPRSKITDAEIRWGDPEYRTESQLADATIKKYQAGLITWRQALEDLGYGDTVIARMEKQRTQDALLNQSLNLNSLVDEQAS